MQLFQQKKTTDELEGERDDLILEEEVETKRASIAEKQAVIRQLKKTHGGGGLWQKFTGLNPKSSFSELKSALHGMKEGLQSQAENRSTKGMLSNPNLSPLPRQRRPDDFNSR